MVIAEKVNLRQEQALETRQKLLDSARRLFAEKGYAGTAVRAINRSIGMADGLMYHYFPGGKKEILQVLIQEDSAQIQNELASRYPSIYSLPIEEVLEQIYRNADELFTKYLDTFKIVFRDSEVRETAKQLRIDVLVLENRKRFPEMLRRRAAAGEIREIDYDGATEVLVAVITNHFLFKLTNLGPGRLSDPKYRKKLIAYQVGLWKIPQP